MHAKTVIGLVGLGALAGVAHGHGEGDIGLLWDGFNIITAVADDESGAFTEIGEFVFAAELEDLGGGFVGSDGPGFFTTDGPTNTIGAFDAGTVLSYDTLSALRVWNGSDFSQVATPQLAQDYGGNTILTPMADALTPGFDFTYGGGDFDEHPDYSLVNPAAGIYLWEIRFSATAPTGEPLDTTGSLYVVFNYDVDDSIHDEAIEWVEKNLPAPSGLALLGLGGAFATRRRRA
jgi:hypothetical protein